MMKFHLKATANADNNSDADLLFSLPSGKKVYANLNDAKFRLPLKENVFVCLYGDVFYHWNKDESIHLLDNKSGDYLKSLFLNNDLEAVISRLEGQYIGLYVDQERRLVRLFGDRYGRENCFYSASDAGIYFSTDLDFIFQHLPPEPDQKMLTHLFSVYGWFAPKGFTIYKNVHELRVGEMAVISEKGLQKERIEFQPLTIENYNPGDLENYYKILKDSVIARADRQGDTWVSSSSGWDSSMILGILVDAFGPGKVRMLTGSMKYSDETETINRFEMDKIKKIGAYYDIKPEVVEFDFKSKEAPSFWKKINPYCKARHSYSTTNYNFFKLSDRLSGCAGENQVLLNGETSDSFHNFGFSQFATFFHSKKSFTEFADKMNCYLYGPSFFAKVLKGDYERDKVFQIFKKMFEHVEFVSPCADIQDRVANYLSPFIYGSPRIPFVKTDANPLLTSQGQEGLRRFTFETCIPEIIPSLSAENIYSWLIYLYHNFHAQGSTVSIQKIAMHANGHRSRMPFNDYRLIDFLSKMPENWGRGLELNHAKYPLKWVARHKIKFPFEVLEEGPHSYLYDVIEGFSLAAEITYRSGMSDFYKESLSSRSYQNFLSEEYFNMKYLDALVDDYLNGKEASGRDFTNLHSLITLVSVGWY